MPARFRFSGGNCCCCDDLYQTTGTLVSILRVLRGRAEPKRLKKEVSFVNNTTDRVSVAAVDYRAKRFYTGRAATPGKVRWLPEKLLEEGAAVPNWTDVIDHGSTYTIQGLGLDSLGQQIFYTVKEIGTTPLREYIRRVDYDGTNDQQIYDPGITASNTARTVRDEHFCRVNRRVYFMQEDENAGGNTSLKSMEPDGTDVQTLRSFTKSGANGQIRWPLTHTQRQKLYWHEVRFDGAPSPTTRTRLYEADLDATNEQLLRDEPAGTHVRLAMAISNKHDRLLLVERINNVVTWIERDLETGDQETIATQADYVDAAGQTVGQIVDSELGCGMETFGNETQT